jgi:hypothetical protein
MVFFVIPKTLSNTLYGNQKNFFKKKGIQTSFLASFNEIDLQKTGKLESLVR